MKKLNLFIVLTLTLLLSAQVFADDNGITNERFALGAMSLCALNETLQTKDAINVYVMGNPDVAEELRIFLDQRVGFIKLNSIKAGEELPQEKPDVLLLCSDNDCEKVVQYCRDNKVFSVSNSSSLCQRGISTAIVSKISQTKEYKYSMTSVFAKINKAALFAEGVVFNPQIMNVAKPVEEDKFNRELVMVQLY